MVPGEGEGAEKTGVQEAALIFSRSLKRAKQPSTIPIAL